MVTTPASDRRWRHPRPTIVCYESRRPSERKAPPFVDAMRYPHHCTPDCTASTPHDDQFTSPKLAEFGGAENAASAQGSPEAPATRMRRTQLARSGSRNRPSSPGHQVTPIDGQTAVRMTASPTLAVSRSRQQKEIRSRSQAASSDLPAFRW